MDCLQIDWGNEIVEDTFVRDEFYENIQAPKWIDFTAPLVPVDDHEWFCGNASGSTHEEKSFNIPTHDDIMAVDVIEKNANAKMTRKLLVSSSLSSLSEVRVNVHKSINPLPPIGESKGMEKTMRKPIHRQNLAGENVNPNQAKLTKHPFPSCMQKIKVSETNKESRTHSIRASRDHKLFNKIGINSGKEATIDAACKSIARKKDGILQQGKNQTPKKQQQDLGDIEHVNRAKKVEEGGRSPFSTRPIDRNHHLKASFSTYSKNFSMSAHCENVDNNEKELLTSKVGSKPKQHKFVGDGHNEDSSRTLVDEGNIKDDVKFSQVSVLPIENIRKNVLTITLEEENEQQCHENFSEHNRGELSKHPLAFDKIIINPRTASQLLQEEAKNEQNSCSYQYKHTPSNEECMGSSLEELFLKNLCFNEDPSEHCSNMVEKQSLEQRCSSGNAQQEDMDETESLRCFSSQSVVSAHEIMSGYSVSNPSHNLDGDCETSRTRSISSKEGDSTQRKIKKSEVTKNVKSNLDWRTSCGIKTRNSIEINCKINYSSKTHTYLKHEVQKVQLNRAFAEHPTSLNPQPRQAMVANSSSYSNCCTSVKPFRFRTEERGNGRRKGLLRRSNTEELIEKALRIRTSAHQPFRPQRSTKKLTVPREPKFHQSARSRRACIIGAVMEQSGCAEK